MQRFTTRTRLQVIRREGQLWAVLGIYERERKNRYTLDCVALESGGTRRDFTAGGLELGSLREVTVTLQVAIPRAPYKACERCGGLGRVGDAPCDPCRGSGEVE